MMKNPKKFTTIDWKAISEKLPIFLKTDTEEILKTKKKKLNEIFKKLDGPNGNGFLSVSELNKGIGKLLEI